MEPTPLIKQYLEIKNRYKEEFVFFQVGDFYELFFSDAEKASSLLSITLTKRGYHNGKDIPLCGVPIHASEGYCIKLVKLGYTVVICNQVEDAIPGKIVAREISQVVSPGTLTSESSMDPECDFITAFVSIDNKKKYVSILLFEYIKLKVGKLIVPLEQTFRASIETLFSKHIPKEVYLDNFVKDILEETIRDIGFVQKNIDQLSDLESLKIFKNKYKIEEEYCNVSAIFLNFLEKYHKNIYEKDLYFFNVDVNSFLLMDAATQRHLEIVKNNLDGTSENTLFHVLNHTSTAMGARLLKEWLVKPLCNAMNIEERLVAVTEFVKFVRRKAIKNYLCDIGDIERVCGRVLLKKAAYRDYQRIMNMIPIVFKIKDVLTGFSSSLVEKLNFSIWADYDLYDFMAKYIFGVGEGRSHDSLIISESDKILNDLKTVIQSQTDCLIRFEQNENSKIGFQNNEIKVKNTAVYGYVFEVSKNKKSKLPNEYICVQTLVNKERYTTPELKKFEQKLMSAQFDYKKRERELYDNVIEAVYRYSEKLMETARSLAKLDVILSLSEVACLKNWCCPEINNSDDSLEIVDGKHPVISNLMDHAFVENSISMSSNTSKSWILTGPNMGGKSTFMRQNALIVLLSHIGSFVPAKVAKIPIFNSVYTRIGASDNVIQGKSTFYVEMEEVLRILNFATKKSLVILDEVGRGTGTFDGISLAAAILESIVESNKSYILFATHYHELSSIFKTNDNIKWFHFGVASKKCGKLQFSYRICNGPSNNSFGIEIAREMGIDKTVIENALNYKKMLECKINSSMSSNFECALKDKAGNKKDFEIRKMICDYDLNSLTPKQAHDILFKLQESALSD
jgi:DNA mismatch repair protein MutS